MSGPQLGQSPSGEPSPLLLKLDEAARYLSISARALWGAAKAGKIPVVRIGRSARFDVRDLVAFAEAHKTRGSSHRD